MCCPGLTTGWRNLFWCMPSPTVPRSTKRLLAHPRTTPSLKGLLAVGYRRCSPLSISRPQTFAQPALARSPWCESRLVQSSSRAACLSIPRPGPFCSLGSMASADMTSGMPSCFDRRGQGWRHNSMGLRLSRPTTRTSTGAFLRRHADMLALPPPAITFVCTVRLARRVWGLGRVDLPTVCRRLGIPLVHHDPRSDAAACARIVVAASEATRVSGGCGRG